MNLEKVQAQILQFKSRIQSTLSIQTDDSKQIQTQKFVSSWLKLQTQKIKMELEDFKKKNTGIMGGIRMLGLIKSEKNIKEIEKMNTDLSKLSEHLIKKFIPTDFNFECQQIPKDILVAIDSLKGKQWVQYYACVKGPFLDSKFITKKEHLHENIKKVIVNDLKLIIIQEKVAHKYQRNLVQQIFGRVLRSQGTLTMVLKIEVGDDPMDDPYFLYCYVEDTKFKKSLEWKPINELKIGDNDLYIMHKGKKLESYEENLLQIMLAQIFIMPVQSLVSNFILKVLPDKIEIIKCSEQNQELIVQQKALKSHPSLRNPLLFFTNAGVQKSAKIFKIESITNSEELFQSFYKALNFMVEMIINDFPCTINNEKVINSSLCFNFKTFDAVWNSFHKIVGLKGWLKEVISPIKSTISSSEIFSHFCPIFNELCQYNKDSMETNFDYLQNIEIQSYLTTFIKKKTLEKYKNMYVDIDSDANLLNPITSSKQAYDQIFKPIIEEVDLLYVSTIEAIYIIDFVCRHKFNYQPDSQCLPESWKGWKIWRKCFNYVKSHHLKFIDIGFDMMAYNFGFDTFESDPNAFERIRNYPENQTSIQAIEKFILLIRDKFKQKILSSLLEKAFKHKKYEICKRLLEHHVRIRDFRDTFTFQELMNPKHEILKETIMKKIKKDSPQMHRVFKWQQLLLIELQNQGIQIETFDFGKCYIPEQILSRHIKNGKIENNLSRKDYKFNSKREITQIDSKYCKIFYLEKCLHPLLNYFYKIFYDNLGIPEILPYFTTFFYQNRLFTMIEHLPDVIDYKKGLTSFSEQELNVMTDQKLISMAILSTMALVPKEIHLRDVLIEPSKNERDQLFIVDIQSFYNKNFFMRSGNNISLNCKNTLFTFDIMNKSVHPDVAKKFRDLDVIKFIGDCFEQYTEVIEKINGMRERNCDLEVPIQQFLGIIFENGYILNLTERLFKIKRIFTKKSTQKGISFMNVLSHLDPQMHDFYNQVHQTQNGALKRQGLLFDQNWKKAFVSSTNLIQFFGNFQRPQEEEFQFPDHYYKLCFNGPTESLSSLTQNLKKFTAFSINLPNDLQLYSNEYFEYFIKHVDNSEAELLIREKLMQVIKNKSTKYLENPQKKLLPLTYIRVQSVENMKEKSIHAFSYERVQELVFQNCRIGDYDINNMPKSIENILYLQLKGVTSLKNIGENTLFGDVLEIKHLKVLSIVGCPQLIGVDIRCDILESIELKDNPLLQNIYIYSNFLKNIYCSQNPSLNLENIGLYILKGINVLMCKTACGGDIMKIYQDSYDKYILNLLKFMLSRFFDLEARYYMILTLSKLKEIDDNLFTMAGITTFKGFSMFSKFTQDLEDKILKSIVGLFYTNPFIKTLPTYLLTDPFLSNYQNQAMTVERIFRLMNQTIRKNPNASLFNEICIQKPLRPIPSKVSSNFVDLLQTIRFDKHVSICFENYSTENLSKKPEDKKNVQVQLNKSVDFTKETTVKTKFKNLNSSAIEVIQESNSNDKEEGLTEIIKVIVYLGTEKKGIDRLSLKIKSSTINKQFFDQIFSKCGQKEEKMEEKESSSQGSFGDIANKYKKGFKKMVDKKILKKQTSMDEEIKLPKRKESSAENNRIRKIKIESSVIAQEPLQTQGIFESQFEETAYCSIKELKIIQTKIYSPEFFLFMPFLNNLHLRDVELSFREDRLFSTLDSKYLKTLELSSFFKKTDSSHKFRMFCDFIKNAKGLSCLIFNSNEITAENMQDFNEILNQSKIRQLSFCNIEFFGENEPKEELILKAYSNFLKQSRNMKSLFIQFKKEAYLEAFIQSISENQSIISMNLETSSEISSKIFEPLRKNEYLNSLRSNNELPTWLLTHIKSNNNTTFRKSQVISIIDSDDIQIRVDPTNNVDVDMFNISGTSNRNEDFYRIGLSLDGGGMRGMLLATEMNYLERQVGKPLHKIFDCVGGTSIGGILSLATTGSADGYHPVCDSEHLKEIFTKYGKEIFKKSQIRQFRNLFDTRYSAASFEGVLKNYFKETRLSDVLCDTSVVVTAVNRMDNKDYIFKSKEALLNAERDFYMRDVARSTAAAPIYFPSAQIKNINATMKLSLLDGGMGMNNPSKLVIDEIKKMSTNSGNNENFFLVSLGTGRLPSENIPENAGLKDLSPIIDSFTESANYFTERDLADHYKGHFIRVSPLIDIENKRDAQLDNTSQQILKIYEETGLQSAKKYFKNTVIFGKYRNMNLIEWLQENTARKYDI